MVGGLNMIVKGIGYVLIGIFVYGCQYQEVKKLTQ